MALWFSRQEDPERFVFVGGVPFSSHEEQQKTIKGIEGIILLCLQEMTNEKTESLSVSGSYLLHFSKGPNQIYCEFPSVPLAIAFQFKIDKKIIETIHPSRLLVAHFATPRKKENSETSTSLQPPSISSQNLHEKGNEKNEINFYSDIKVDTDAVALTSHVFVNGIQVLSYSDVEV
jgi:hypothetical protein